MKRMLCILLVAATCAIESVAVAAPSLQTHLTSETNAATAQATLVFTWRIENTGDAAAHLLNHFAYASRGPLLSLRFSQEGRKPVTVELDMRDCIRWRTQGAKILTLKPQQAFRMKARADLKAFGPLVPGRCAVVALYEPKGWAWELLTPELQKELNLKPSDIWDQVLKSNEAEIAIGE